MIARRGPALLLAAVVVLAIAMADDAILAGTRGIGYTVCHQLPAHSLIYGNTQLPLCARCTGIYFGFLVGAAGMALLGKLNASLWPPRAVAGTLLVMMLVMLVDGFNSLSSSLPGAVQAYQPTNLLRLVSGVLAGTALALLLIPSLNNSLWLTRNRVESVSDFGELGGFAILALLAAVLVYAEFPGLLLPVAILGSIGVLATLGAAGTTLIAALLRRERQAQSPVEAIPLFLAGIGVSIVSMVALGAVRYYFAISIGI